MVRIDIALDIATLLTGITSSIFLYSQPNTPDACITIYYSGGTDPQHTFGAQAPQWENPTIQVRVRHTSAVTAMSWCASIKNALDGKTAFTINSHYYMSVFQQGDILPWGRDENNRWEFSINFRIQVRR